MEALWSLVILKITKQGVALYVQYLAIAAKTDSLPSYRRKTHGAVKDEDGSVTMVSVGTIR